MVFGLVALVLNESMPTVSPAPLRISCTNSDAASRASFSLVWPLPPGPLMLPERSMTTMTSHGAAGTGGWARASVTDEARV